MQKGPMRTPFSGSAGGGDRPDDGPKMNRAQRRSLEKKKNK
jgi:hypothetical protein